MYDDLLRCERWLRAHRLVIAAWNLRQHTGPNSPELVRGYLDQQLVGLSLEQFSDLPLLTLDVLARLDINVLQGLGTEGHFAQLQSRLKQARDLITVGSDGGRKASVVRGAQLVAELMLMPSSNARSIARFSSSVLDRSWQGTWRHPVWRRVMDCIPQMQVVEVTTGEKIARIAELANLFTQAGSDAPKYWAHVEYALVNRLLAWPLCASGENGPGMSYPLAIDVHYSGASGIEIVNSPVVKLGDKPDSSDFERALATSLEAAKDLWRSQNGSASRLLRERILGAQLVLNTAPAAALTAPFGEGFGAYIAGRSLEAYIALVALGRLSGIDAFPPIAMSGQIGEPTDNTAQERHAESTVSPSDARVEADRGLFHAIAMTRRSKRPKTESRPLDRVVEPVAGVASKFEWMLLSKQFTTVILPDTSHATAVDVDTIRQQTRAARVDHYTFIETLYVRSLSKAADIAFGARWRRYRTVRANDVLWAMLRHRHTIDYKAPAVRRALAFLAGNAYTLARPREDIRLSDLVAAFAHLNEDWTQLQENPVAKRSIVFFRMVYDEPRARLLTSLFAAIGAHPSELKEVLNAADRHEAAEVLARVLNRTSPPANAPTRRAPDIVVFIMPRPKTEPVARSKVPFDEHLEFNQLFSTETLGALLKPTSHERWATVIARTRIVVVAHEDDPTLGKLVPFGQPPDRSQIDTYRKVDVFRFGFTQAMLGRVVDPQSLAGGPHEWLKRETARQSLHEVGGKYFLSGAVRAALRENVADPERLARAHMNAALAFAPYLDQKDGTKLSPPGLIHREAADPAALHEAQYHLAALSQLEWETKRAGKRDGWRKMMGHHDHTRHHYQAQLSAVFETPNWDLVRFAVAAQQFPEEFLAEVVAAVRALLGEEKLDALPAIRITATLGIFDKYLSSLSGAQFAAARAEVGPDMAKLAKACLKRVRELGKRVEATRGQDREHVRYQYVFAASHLAMFAMGPNTADFAISARQLRELNLIVRAALLENDAKGKTQDTQLGFCVPPEWTDRYAASIVETDRESAIALYRVARAHVRGHVKRRTGIFVGALGAVSSGSVDERAIVVELDELKARDQYKLRRLERAVLAVKDASPHWQAGLRKFREWIATGEMAVSADEVTDEDGADELDGDLYLRQDRLSGDDQAA